jgi:hypothetical protein
MDASDIEVRLAYASRAEVPPSVGTLGRTPGGVHLLHIYILPYSTLYRTELTFFSTRLQVLIRVGSPLIKQPST